MSKENFRAFYITGIRAFQSAAKQATESAGAAIEKLSHPELKEIAGRVKAMMIRQADQLAEFLQEDGAPVDAFHDQIMNGVSRGTTLMWEAAKDELLTDVALISGGTTGMEYFVNAFKGYAAYSETLGYPGRVELFNHMAQENQELIEAYAKVMQTQIIPKIMQK